MANTDRPRGFKPYGELMHVGVYVAGGTIYPGDAVKAEAGAANTTQKRMRVVVAATAQALMGVALNYAVSGDLVRVADDPSQLFEGQGDGADFDENADLGLNTEIVATAGSTTYKASQMEVDTSELATTATLVIKVVGVVPEPNNAFGANVNLIFKINNHQLGSHTGTAGV